MKGQFNVPFGNRPGAYFTRYDLRRCAALLKNALLIEGDFEKTICLVRPRDFVYLDPPFAVKSRRIFRQYETDSFSTTDIPRLDKALRTIVDAGADFLVSYADCTESRGLAKEWNSIRLPVRRNVAGFSGNRRLAYEWLISNTAIADGVRRNSRGKRSNE
jgi:DNA adenine methylase